MPFAKVMFFRSAFDWSSTEKKRSVSSISFSMLLASRFFLGGKADYFYLLTMFNGIQRCERFNTGEEKWRTRKE